MSVPPSRPVALVTNDDGFYADGLRYLAMAARDAGLDIVVAAPMEESSGASAAITAIAEGGHVMIARRGLPGLDGIRTFAVEGSPALIALIALRGAFGRVPEIVLSGINRGANVGTAVMHSGTVGAALTAGVTGYRAMAVSLDLRGEGHSDPDDNGLRHWDTAAGIVRRLLPRLMELPPAAVLNLNVPDLPAEHVKGVRRATLGRFGRVQMTEVEKGSGVVRITLEEHEPNPAPDSDVALLADDYATLTPLRPVSEEALELTLGAAGDVAAIPSGVGT